MKLGRPGAGRVALVGLFVWAGAGVCAAGSGGPPPAAERPSGETFVYECPGGYDFVVRVEGEVAWLFLPGRTARVSKGPGATYRKGDLAYRRRGETASLVTASGTRRECRNDRRNAVWEDAKLRGVDFRAVGNEPGWYLELDRSRIVFVGGHGQIRRVFPTPAPAADRVLAKTIYEIRDEDHEMTVVLEGRPCRDTMSGASFETTVRVVLDGRKLAGCGRALH